MAGITVLDQSTIDQIAAGEVIERPASIVKELVENAIDAGAGAITVEIRDGGIGFIRITDNGCGIEAAEVPLAFLSHATSKIRNAGDLVSVTSLGFRGEALSSIAAIARVELITRQEHALTGTRYVIEGGEEKQLEEIGAPYGTTFLIRDVFFQTPVRKKFLKTPQTEASHIGSVMEHLALSHPDISFHLIQEGQTKLHTSGTGQQKDLIYTVFGRDAAAALLPLDTSSELIHITGNIGKPSFSRGNRDFENYFINGRYMKSKLIAKAIEDAYKTFVMQHRYPFVVLYLSIDHSLIDINVHPAKMELRFSDQQLVYDTIYRAVRHTLENSLLIPEVSFEKKEKEPKNTQITNAKIRIPEPFEAARKPAKADGEVPHPLLPTPGEIEQFLREKQRVAREKAAAHEMPSEAGMQHLQAASLNKAAVHEMSSAERIAEQGAYTVGKQDTATQRDLFTEKLIEPGTGGKAQSIPYQLIGQLFETYWLLQYEEKLYIVDQHAAHEKVIYERLRKRQNEKLDAQASQILMPPVVITLSLREEETLQQYASYFTKMGFGWDHFGGREYNIREVPMDLYDIDCRKLFLELLDGLSEHGDGYKPDVIYDRLASLACKAAVKGMRVMKAAEADTLIGELLSLEHPFTCPHGRPTIISMTKQELEKKFKRIV